MSKEKATSLQMMVVRGPDTLRHYTLHWLKANATLNTHTQTKTRSLSFFKRPYLVYFTLFSLYPLSNLFDSGRVGGGVWWVAGAHPSSYYSLDTSCSRIHTSFPHPWRDNLRFLNNEMSMFWSVGMFWTHYIWKFWSVRQATRLTRWCYLLFAMLDPTRVLLIMLIVLQDLLKGAHCWANCRHMAFGSWVQ